MVGAESDVTRIGFVESEGWVKACISCKARSNVHPIPEFSSLGGALYHCISSTPVIFMQDILRLALVNCHKTSVAVRCMIEHRAIAELLGAIVLGSPKDHGIRCWMLIDELELRDTGSLIDCV